MTTWLYFVQKTPSPYDMDFLGTHYTLHQGPPPLVGPDPKVERIQFPPYLLAGKQFFCYTTESGNNKYIAFTNGGVDTMPNDFCIEYNEAVRVLYLAKGSLSQYVDLSMGKHTVIKQMYHENGLEGLFRVDLLSVLSSDEKSYLDSFVEELFPKPPVDFAHLSMALPGVNERVEFPCLLEDEHCSYKASDPKVKITATLRQVIMHLNDFHEWPREKIADWLETLDIDLEFKDA